nr:DUF6050 family protein [uncultured Mediterraneibacter sp.]
MRQEIFCRMIFVTEVFLWTVIFYPFCVEAGTCDYLKLWILVGIPFGIRKMQIWIVPRNRDAGSTIAMLVFQMLIGGMIGGVILVWKLFLLLVFMVLQLYRGIKKLIK